MPSPNTENNNVNDLDRKTIIETDAELKQIEGPLSQIPDLLSQNSDLLGGAEVQELLQRLTDATGMAGDVESKLDDVLAKLDGLLDVLGIDPASLEESEQQEPIGSPNGKSFTDGTSLSDRQTEQSQPSSSKTVSTHPHI